MTLIIYLALIVCLVGLIVWGTCVSVSKAWLAEVGRIAFAAGLLAFLITSGATLSTCNSSGTSIRAK